MSPSLVSNHSLPITQPLQVLFNHGIQFLRFRHLLKQGLGELLHFFFEQFAVVFDFGGADVAARR